VAGKIWVTGLDQRAKEVDVVCVRLKPVRGCAEVKNISPAIKTWCAVIHDLNERLLLTQGVVKLLRQVQYYEVPTPVEGNRVSMVRTGADGGNKIAETGTPGANTTGGGW